MDRKPIQRIAVPFEVNQKLKQLAAEISKKEGKSISVQDIVLVLINKYLGDHSGV